MPLLVGNALLVHDLPQTVGMIGRTASRHEDDDCADNDEAGGDKEVSALVPQVSHEGICPGAAGQPIDDKDLNTGSRMPLPLS
jgi:hypothetical protein